MQKRECNSQSYERNALLTFMNPCLIITAVTASHWLGVGKICTTPAYESFIWMLFGLLWNMIQNIMLYYTIHKIRATLFTSPPHLLPFGQCIVEQTTLPLLNSLIVYCRVSSNFHFSLSIILFLVQKYWFIKKISRGGWSGFGKALVWIDPNCHENCLDWSKLFSSLSKLHPNRRCSVILPFRASLSLTISLIYHLKLAKWFVTWLVNFISIII